MKLERNNKGEVIWTDIEYRAVLEAVSIKSRLLVAHEWGVEKGVISGAVNRAKKRFEGHVMIPRVKGPKATLAPDRLSPEQFAILQRDYPAGVSSNTIAARMSALSDKPISGRYIRLNANRYGLGRPEGYMAVAQKEAAANRKNAPAPAAKVVTALTPEVRAIVADIFAEVEPEPPVADPRMHGVLVSIGASKAVPARNPMAVVPIEKVRVAVPFLSQRSKRCAFPLWSHNATSRAERCHPDGEPRFCGAPVTDVRLPYCSECAAKCYNRPPRIVHGHLQ